MRIPLPCFLHSYSCTCIYILSLCVCLFSGSSYHGLWPIPGRRVCCSHSTGPWWVDVVVDDVLLLLLCCIFACVVVYFDPELCLYVSRVKRSQH